MPAPLIWRRCRRHADRHDRCRGGRPHRRGRLRGSACAWPIPASAPSPSAPCARCSIRAAPTLPLPKDKLVHRRQADLPLPTLIRPDPPLIRSIRRAGETMTLIRPSRLASLPREFGRRGLIAGTAALLASPLPAAQTAAAQAPAPAAPGGQSAVIDVDRARTEPIPIAIPPSPATSGDAEPAGPGHRRRHHQQSRPLRPVPADRPGGVHQRAGTARGAQLPELEGDRRPGAGDRHASKARAATRCAWSSGCGTCCPAADPGHRLHHHAHQLAAHRPHHQRRDLRAAAGREGLFRHPHRLYRRHRAARPAHQAARHHGPGRREQPFPDRRQLPGPDPALSSDPG